MHNALYETVLYMMPNPIVPIPGIGDEEFPDGTSRHYRPSGTRIPKRHRSDGRFGMCCSVQGSQQQYQQA